MNLFFVEKIYRYNITYEVIARDVYINADSIVMMYGFADKYGQWTCLCFGDGDIMTGSECYINESIDTIKRKIGC